VRRAKDLGRTSIYLLLALPVGAAAAVILVAGWAVCAFLAITPLVVPALVAFRAAVGAVARADAEVANALLGTTVRPPISSPGRPGFWRRGGNVLGDEAFWEQQVHLLQRFVLGWALAVIELALLAAGAAAIVEPIVYRWTNQDIGSWHVDSLGRALLFVVPGVLALVLAVVLIRPFGAVARSLVVGLLRSVAPADPAPFAHTRAMRVRSLAIHAAVFVGLSVLTTLVWALTSRGYFWPAWVMLVFALPLAIHAWLELVELRPAVASRQRLTRGLAIHEGVSVAFALFLVGIWLLAGHGYFWPAWPILVLLVVFGVHAAFVLGPAWRNGTLAERVAALETSRAGAVDQQDAELRRIERDLHDGAQARLVALGMSLGMAEQKLASDPDGARELLADARRGAHEALEELRDLARGIHPPVLADRGLEAAIAALASRTPLHVRVLVDVDERPAPPVESAAYFVVAEALANTGKHAHAEHVDIAVRRRRDSMLVEIVDDGVGGADRSGSGLSGLARRVEALDGTLEISSPEGGPTTVRAVMPCGS
jgi:signal transduction histidine kinase